MRSGFHFLACLLLSACMSGAAPVARVDQDAVTAYRAAGYPRPSGASLQVRRISSPPADTAIWNATLVRGAERGPLPVIVFLPALGEHDGAESFWIAAWAQAGYAVLCIQPLDDDANAWTGVAARSGDFERVARERFAPRLMPQRVAQLSRVLGLLRAGTAAGDPALADLDWSRTALAGADLGAYTVEAVLTMPARDLAALSWPLQIRAALVLSPHPLHEGAVQSGMPAPHAPALVLSAPDDVDAYGVVTDPGLRRAAFDALGPGNDYYLELEGVSHRWLAGYLPASGVPETAPRRATGQQETDRHNRRSGSGQHRDNMAPGSEEDEDPAAQAASLSARQAAVLERSKAMTRAALSLESARAITCAFLDATVREQPVARTWLADSAARWLQPGDRLKHR